LLATLGGDCSFLLPVTFVADQNLINTLGRMLLYVGEPCSDICRDLLALPTRPQSVENRLLKERSSVTS
jgi:hypothetical protein